MTASLDLTHVLYDDTSVLSLALALVTLSPILLMPAYAALAVHTRELGVINMWAGQFLCEGLNWILKHLIKQHRPDGSLSYGYGFPSSHSQYMAYFASFLICHVYFRHRFPTTGSTLLDRLVRSALYLALALWAAVVAYSRYHLKYHSPHQILWGLAIGVAFGTSFYTLAELIPSRRPDSLLGRLRTLQLDNPVSQWVRVRDGWLVWSDGGHEDEWVRWRVELDRRRRKQTE